MNIHWAFANVRCCSTCWKCGTREKKKSLHSHGFHPWVIHAKIWDFIFEAAIIDFLVRKDLRNLLMQHWMWDTNFLQSFHSTHISLALPSELHSYTICLQQWALWSSQMPAVGQGNGGCKLRSHLHWRELPPLQGAPSFYWRVLLALGRREAQLSPGPQLAFTWAPLFFLLLTGSLRQTSLGKNNSSPKL